MKKLREIVYKTLVDNFNISPNLLSRIEGDDPIAIELKGGEEIFVYLNDRTLQTFIEIPLRDQRMLKNKAPKIIENLMSDEEMFFNIKKEKLILVTEFSADIANVERVLADKLKLFNNVVAFIKI
ncbi:hypothetical protein [Shewanella sp. CG12_big_fil_rev_8_21_14_0_65_47_15]|uniref:hypothetical protein n=1 Tax=Shewanella sp. CG12_big_fil_rev_8_21_14_0_65_47_15 TaxID=1975537 RepID=UPI000CC3A69C|nr:hypothetical protein [Shewanella sp. CG12_big_fil_rev_8_21_14_0_65_47_15]PIW61452.1 MAG: hypothetical protein COW15_07775 [Shewanella sp. CG12_big_fil_rev_8_21_14_0_65_47_15]